MKEDLMGYYLKRNSECKSFDLPEIPIQQQQIRRLTKLFADWDRVHNNIPGSIVIEDHDQVCAFRSIALSRHKAARRMQD